MDPDQPAVVVKGRSRRRRTRDVKAEEAEFFTAVDEALSAHVRKTIDSLRPTIAALEQRVREQVTETLRPAIEAMAALAERAFAEHPVRRQVATYAARRGWFLSPGMPLFDRELESLVESDDREGVDAHLAAIVENGLAEIVERVANVSPGRRPIVEDAVRAHRAELYSLSIPALIAQADGLADDVTGSHLFTRQGRSRLKAADALNLRIDMAAATTAAAMWALAGLEPIRSGSSLDMKSSAWAEARELEAVGPLNRHAVLRGIDLTYPTRENSLRAFSLVDYMAGLPDVVSMLPAKEPPGEARSAREGRRKADATTRSKPRD